MKEQTIGAYKKCKQTQSGEYADLSQVEVKKYGVAGWVLCPDEELLAVGTYYKITTALQRSQNLDSDDLWKILFTQKIADNSYMLQGNATQWYSEPNDRSPEIMIGDFQKTQSEVRPAEIMTDLQSIFFGAKTALQNKDKPFTKKVALIAMGHVDQQASFHDAKVITPAAKMMDKIFKVAPHSTQYSVLLGFLRNQCILDKIPTPELPQQALATFKTKSIEVRQKVETDSILQADYTMNIQKMIRDKKQETRKLEEGKIPAASNNSGQSQDANNLLSKELKDAKREISDMKQKLSDADNALTLKNAVIENFKADLKENERKSCALQAEIDRIREKPGTGNTALPESNAQLQPISLFQVAANQSPQGQMQNPFVNAAPIPTYENSASQPPVAAAAQAQMDRELYGDD